MDLLGLMILFALYNRMYHNQVDLSKRVEQAKYLLYLH